MIPVLPRVPGPLTSGTRPTACPSFSCCKGPWIPAKNNLGEVNHPMVCLPFYSFSPLSCTLAQDTASSFRHSTHKVPESNRWSNPSLPKNRSDFLGRASTWSACDEDRSTNFNHVLGFTISQMNRLLRRHHRPSPTVHNTCFCPTSAPFSVRVRTTCLRVPATPNCALIEAVPQSVSPQPCLVLVSDFWICHSYATALSLRGRRESTKGLLKSGAIRHSDLVEHACDAFFDMAEGRHR